ncbi:hypothetical protein EIN_470010 [Entamoeba invadens IP1]|uniref:Uncharacterized protein n=1 Tax=Entamoeba invadens IP1 TaxID=370355 RepID=A0A0A1TUL4_ENTIV|nr:hypothetical protein EIN_470010 [Entamoeba invadens IP1]ELP83767.1 hypothetical protein EIN_470010 [Entamoeba invadens IP1]|eukprot:XP_004183113.1 hypothetical protein EIN_470010 [Entamoeba invadens IP1]
MSTQIIEPVDQQLLKKSIMRFSASLVTMSGVTFFFSFVLLLLVSLSLWTAFQKAFLFTCVFAFQSLLLYVIKTEDHVSNKPENYCNTFAGVSKTIICMLVSVFVGYFSMIILKGAVPNSDDVYEVDELHMVFAVSGIFFGLTNTFSYVFLDLLSFKSFTEQASENDRFNLIIKTLNQTSILFMMNLIVFAVAVVLVKLYDSFLYGLGFDLTIRFLSLGLADIIQYVVLIFLFSLCSRYAYRYLFYRLSLQ